MGVHKCIVEGRTVVIYCQRNSFIHNFSKYASRVLRNVFMCRFLFCRIHHIYWIFFVALLPHCKTLLSVHVPAVTRFTSSQHSLHSRPRQGIILLGMVAAAVLHAKEIYGLKAVGKYF